MLTLHWIADDLVDRYAGFCSALTWHRMYCTGRFGQKKQDYVDGFRNLFDAYEHLWDVDDEKPPDWQLQPLTNLFEAIRKVLNSKRITTEQVDRIGTLISEFQYNDERTLKANYVKAQVHEDLMRGYPKELYEAVYGLLDSENTDEAIVTAFKFLDSHLQKLLGLTPFQYYGEDLINYAFAPKSGVLQLCADPNEQVGLRNFFSGANAIFRNPPAHRFIKHDLFFAASIVAMVSAMAHMATEIANREEK